MGNLRHAGQVGGSFAGNPTQHIWCVTSMAFPVAISRAKEAGEHDDDTHSFSNRDGILSNFRSCGWVLGRDTIVPVMSATTNLSPQRALPPQRVRRSDPEAPPLPHTAWNPEYPSSVVMCSLAPWDGPSTETSEGSAP